MSFDVPVLLCVFNRPALTEQVFDAIARQRPKHLLIAGDGARPDFPEDQEFVDRTRQIVERVDWDCTVQAKFSGVNLGCRMQMANAITWGFQQHERLIILEDDCLPHESFFPYCERLLEHYADTPEVMTVSGNNYPTNVLKAHGYRFSKYPLIWGWASWRRAWKHYDLEMSSWQLPENQERVLNQFTESNSERQYWKGIFDQQAAGNINTWDYSWTYASWLHRGLTVLPESNLVSNIGFGDHATHTFDELSPMANRLTFPARIRSHPDSIERDIESDRAIRDVVFGPSPKAPRERSLVSKLLRLSTQKLSSLKLF